MISQDTLDFETGENPTQINENLDLKTKGVSGSPLIKVRSGSWVSQDEASPRQGDVQRTERLVTPNAKPNQNLQDQYFTLFADGGSRGNPGPAGSGIAVYSSPTNFLTYQECQKLEPILIKGFFCGHTTNNVAEWTGLLEGLNEILKLSNSPKIQVYLDSQLVVRQVTGQYKVKQPHLIPIHLNVKNLTKKCQTFKIEHIYREFNSVADKAVNDCLDNL